MADHENPRIAQFFTMISKIATKILNYNPMKGLEIDR